MAGPNVLGRQVVSSPKAKAKVLGIVENLRAALKERIEQLDWMSASTKVDLP